MIVHQPEIQKSNGEITIAARVETQDKIPGLPEVMWFTFPESCEPWISERGDGFLASILVPAMYFQEKVEIRPIVSPRTAYNLDETMNALFHRSGGKLKPIELKFHDFSKPDSEKVAGGVGTAFSGGVDSFFTLWSHLPQNQPIEDARLTHGIFVQGFFDINFHHQAYYAHWLEIYSRLFEENHLKLLQVRTNVGYFSHPWVDWAFGHIPSLIGISMILGRLFRRFYIPSSGERPHEQINYGTPTTQLLSTETLEAIYHAPRINRLEKTKTISQWDQARNLLRVCVDHKKDIGITNCGKCEKCLRTIITLNILDLHQPFPSLDYLLNLRTWLRWLWVNKNYHKDYIYLIEYAKKYRKWGIYFLLRLVYYPGILKMWLYNKFLTILSKDQYLKFKRWRTGYSDEQPSSST
jgi:hypothetical protein